MGLSGMVITMLNSMANFGRFNSLHLYLTGIWGWNTSAIIGLSLEVVFICFLPKTISFIHKGTVEIPGLNTMQIEQNNDLHENLDPFRNQIEDFYQNKEKSSSVDKEDFE